MKSLLFVSPVEVDRPVDGLRWRAHLTARALASVGALTVLEVTTDGGREGEAVVHTARTPLRRALSRVHPTMPPRIAARDWRPAAGRLGQLDAVDLVWVMQPDLVGAGLTLPRGPLVVDMVDLEEGKHSGSTLGDRHQRRCWSALQRRVFERADAVVLAHPGEAATVDHPSVHVLPNAVDVVPVRSVGGQPTLTLIGRFTYQPNREAAVWFVASVWPLIRAADPAARLLLVGRHDGALDALSEVDGVEVRGFVPDLTAVWEQTTALIAPIRTGTGTRLKIIEAFAREVPVVSTTVGCDGLAVQHEKQLLIADRPDDLARECGRMLADAALRDALRRQARALADAEHSPVVVERVVAEVVGTVTGASP